LTSDGGRSRKNYLTKLEAKVSEKLAEKVAEKMTTGGESSDRHTLTGTLSFSQLKWTTTTQTAIEKVYSCEGNKENLTY